MKLIYLLGAELVLLRTGKITAVDNCGCLSCTFTVLDKDAGGHSVGSRIEWVMTNQDRTEEQACNLICGEEFVEVCGAECTPGQCTSEPEKCGCSSCTDSILERDSEGHSVGNRIKWVVDNMGSSENEACSYVCGFDYPSICGEECDPDQCSPPRPTPPPTLRPTPPPTQRPTPLPTQPSKPRARPKATSTSSNTQEQCGCSLCTKSVLDRDAEGYSVRSRIKWVVENMGSSENEACSYVCGFDYPNTCRECDPNQCDDSQPSTKKQCGGAVNTGQDNCQNALWTPTDDKLMHCYAYGGDRDPCALHNNNDLNDGLDKDPSDCQGDNFDTFYLWDEPDTNGRSYAWAGHHWASYAEKFKNQIQTMRRLGVKFTSPLIRAGNLGKIRESASSFYRACGSACSDPSSPAFINVIAVNAFCGPWNINDHSNPTQGCRDGASFIVSEVRALAPGEGAGLPVYILNWSRLHVSRAVDQLPAIDTTDEFFKEGSPVERVYWFGARDYGGGSSNNSLDSATDSGTRGGSKTLGQAWKEKCDSL